MADARCGAKGGRRQATAEFDSPCQDIVKRGRDRRFGEAGCELPQGFLLLAIERGKELVCFEWKVDVSSVMRGTP